MGEIQSSELGEGVLPATLEEIIDLQSPVRIELVQMKQWSLSEVRRLYRLYRSRFIPPDIPYIVFNKLVSGRDYNVETMFHAFATPQTTVNIFEFISALVLTSHSNYLSKLKFFFLIFDLESVGRLDPLQFLHATNSMICARTRLVGGPLLPKAQIKAVAEAIFSFIDSDKSQAMEFNEFKKFFEINRGLQKIWTLFEPKESVRQPFEVMLPFKGLDATKCEKICLDCILERSKEKLKSKRDQSPSEQASRSKVQEYKPNSVSRLKKARLASLPAVRYKPNDSLVEGEAKVFNSSTSVDLSKVVAESSLNESSGSHLYRRLI